MAAAGLLAAVGATIRAFEWEADEPDDGATGADVAHMVARGAVFLWGACCWPPPVCALAFHPSCLGALLRLAIPAPWP
eukprot:2992888-Alexandrium_andersonii.AAC.1